MKKLLIIPSWQIWPLNTGGANAQTYLLNELMEQLEVHIVLTQYNTDRLDEFKANYPKLHIHYINTSTSERKETHKEKLKKNINRIINRIIKIDNQTNFTSQAPIDNLSDRLKYVFTINKPLSDKIKELDLNYKFDFIQYEMEGNIPLALDYQTLGKKILVLHEVTSKIVEQMVALMPKINEQYSRIIIDTFKNYEKNVLDIFDEIIVFNEDDKHCIQNMVKNKIITVSPYSIPYNTNSFMDDAKKYDLTFIGSGHHYPNLHGLEWFITKVLPLIIKQHPNIKLFITGQWQISFQKQYTSNNIVFLGNINRNEYDKLLASNIMISPIFIGSGLRTKLLDNLQIGVPIVSSVLEQKLIPELEHEKNIMLAQTAEEFNLAINQLLTDTGLRKQISQEARLLFKKSFHHEILAQRRMKIYK